jgi:hypothetical protein
MKLGSATTTVDGAAEGIVLSWTVLKSSVRDARSWCLAIDQRIDRLYYLRFVSGLAARYKGTTC